MIVDVEKVFIGVTTPPEYTEAIRNAMCDAGAGVMGNYSYCTLSLKNIGTFKPNEKANPYIGTKNNLEFVQEDRIEVICEISKVKQVIEAMKKIHPYEEPGIFIIPLIDVETFK